MSDAKHTLGPWETEYRIINDDGMKAQVIYPADDRDNFIATAHWHSVKTETGFTTDREANARLIAAAPDLLAALEELIYLSDNDGPFAGEIWQDRCERGWNQARAAIAKAKGETP